MKTITLIFLIFGLSVTVQLAQKPTSPTEQPKQVLVDFRQVRRRAPPKIPQTTQRAVLPKLFTKYLTDQGKCNPQFSAGGSDHLQAARTAGQIVPSIVDMATGSFTGPAKTETAYIIWVGECNASHADDFGTKRIAIFSGQQLIANTDLDFKSSIALKTDLNGDGQHELLMTSSYMNQGILNEMAAMLTFPEGRLRVIENFGIVLDDSCASLAAGSSAKASVISVSQGVPGKMPGFRRDNYQAGCNKPRRWRFLSTGRMQD